MTKMERLRDWLIHKLGGYTMNDMETSERFWYTIGKGQGMGAIKRYCENNYGKDWRAQVYKMACEADESTSSELEELRKRYGTDRRAKV